MRIYPGSFSLNSLFFHFTEKNNQSLNLIYSFTITLHMNDGSYRLIPFTWLYISMFAVPKFFYVVFFMVSLEEVHPFNNVAF